jgi:hypothetical protein
LEPNAATVCQVVLASQATTVPFTAASNGPDRTPWTTPARPRPAAFLVHELFPLLNADLEQAAAAG